MSKGRKVTKPGYKVRVALTPATISDLHRLASEKAFGQKRMMPSDDYMEQQYQQNLLGGYSRKQQKCSKCFTPIRKNGTCNCI